MPGPIFVGVSTSMRPIGLRPMAPTIVLRAGAVMGYVSVTPIKKLVARKRRRS